MVPCSVRAVATDSHHGLSEVSSPDPARAPTASANLGAVLVLAVLAGTFSWWALKSGAYFGSVLYPGAFLLALTMVVLLRGAPWRANLGLSKAVKLTLVSLVGLAAWSAASGIWSPTPDIAVADAQRMLAYTLAFGLGLWGCALLRTRMELAMLPLVAAAAIAGIVTLIALLGASGPEGYLDEGTLEYPLGYRNATAAFFLIALWPAIGLASSVRTPTPLRVASFMTATLCIELGILAQSRASLGAAIVGLVVYVLAAPRRVHSLAWLLLAALPAVPTLFLGANELFDAAKSAADVSESELSTAARVALMGVAGAPVLALLAMQLDPIRPPGWATRARIRVAAVAAVVAVAVAGVALIGNPIAWGSDRVDEFLAGETDFSEKDNRFTFDAGSNRKDVWRVGLEAADEDPVFGDGGGGFQYRYTRDRGISSKVARDAHSVWLETLSELGLVGLGLFAAAMVGAFAGAIRSRRLGPAAAQLSCAALAAGAYWLAHASVDWFWPYPAVTAPVLALLGAAAAPALATPSRKAPSRAPRIALLLATIAFGLSILPPYLSERLDHQALAIFRVDQERAYENLDLARALNPLSDTPIIDEALIARELGDRKRAIAAFREAARKRPGEYANHYFLADLYVKDDPARARAELAVVKALNPMSTRIERLEERIERSEMRLDGRTPGR